jgi:hypothetical protein
MKVIRLTIVAVFSLLFVSCEDGFEETNINPNLIDKISPGTLLNEVIYRMASNNLTNYYNVTAPLMQVKLNFPSFYGGVHRYEIIESTGKSNWDASYQWAKNVQEMLAASNSAGDPNYQAISLTLNAWIYANLTDNFGDVPMTEASQAEEDVFQPKFDSQELIYDKILEDLETANALYDHSRDMVYGTEILFQNNTELWQKFTNSLRLRLLLRISDVRPNAYEEMVNIITNPAEYPIIDEYEEGAILKVSGITPNLSPWSRALDFSNGHVVAEYFIETLNDLNDPRRPYFATPAHDLQGNEIGFAGIPSAYDGDDSQFQYSPSYMNNEQVVAPMEVPILTYAEVEFIKAELAQKGYLSDAEMHYKEGVKAAIQFWTGEPVGEEYFNNEFAKYDGTLERIMLQKYLALYFTDYQQWYEYRRTGFPVLPKTNSMLNDGIMPSRFLYPGDLQIYNTDNYRQAVQNMGGDDINSKVWWDVN